MSSTNTAIASPVLQARLNTTGGNDPCVLCDRWFERTIGMTETYLADTTDCVCQDCAFNIDPELARFTYAPELSSKKRKFKDDHYFGVCPECGSEPTWLHVYKDHWLTCDRHGLKWWAGSNLISSWMLVTEAGWARNAEELTRYRVVEPYINFPTRWQRLRSRLRQLWSELRPKKAGHYPLSSSDDFGAVLRNDPA